MEMSDGSGGVRGLMNLTPEAHIFYFLLSSLDLCMLACEKSSGSAR
jgi:hypothetical protein